MGSVLAVGAVLAFPIAVAAQSGGDPLQMERASNSYTTSALAALFLVILLNAFFVASEAAIDLLRPAHARLFEKESPRAATLNRLLKHKSRYQATCSLGSHTMRAWMIILSFIPAPEIASWASNQGWIRYSAGSVLLAAVALTLPVAALNMVFGELIPKTYASIRPSAVALRLAFFIQATAPIFAVPGNVLAKAADVFTRRFGASATYSVVNQAEAEIKSLVETAQETGEIEEEEKELLHSVFEFTDTVAREVMTPRVDMDAVPIGADAETIIKLVQETGHSRIPVYEDTDDQIIGIVHAKDLLANRVRSDHPLNLRTILHPALFVPENKNLHDLLREMRQSRSQMAIVQDEFGGTAGIVTIEDIVEELVGDIVDEYDVETPDVIAEGNGFLVNGKYNLYDLNEEIGSDFASDEFDTVGGYVFGLFGRQPQVGDSLEDSGYLFRVVDTDGRRILRLYVEPARPADSSVEDPPLVGK